MQGFAAVCRVVRQPRRTEASTVVWPICIIMYPLPNGHYQAVACRVSEWPHNTNLAYRLHIGGYSKSWPLRVQIQHKKAMHAFGARRLDLVAPPPPPRWKPCKNMADAFHCFGLGTRRINLDDGLAWLAAARHCLKPVGSPGNKDATISG